MPGVFQRKTRGTLSPKRVFEARLLTLACRYLRRYLRVKITGSRFPARGKNMVQPGGEKRGEIGVVHQRRSGKAEKPRSRMWVMKNSVKIPLKTPS